MTKNITGFVITNMLISKTTWRLLTVCILFNSFCILYAEDEQAEGQSVSLVKNGGVEKSDKNDKTKPACWDKPDGLGIKWVEAPAHGKVIRMDTSVSEKAMSDQRKKVGITQWKFPNPSHGPIGATYGLSCYSDTIPVKSGLAYRVSFDFKTQRPCNGAKVWVRGYGRIKGKQRRRYETIVNCRVQNNKWTKFSQMFNPTKHTPKVTEMKVMLFAYWPAGIYLFDNVHIDPVI